MLRFGCFLIYLSEIKLYGAGLCFVSEAALTHAAFAHGGGSLEPVGMDGEYFFYYYYSNLISGEHEARLFEYHFSHIADFTGDLEEKLKRRPVFLIKSLAATGMREESACSAGR